MTGRQGPILVIGIGNLLVRDDGIGVHVVRAIERLAERGLVELPPNTRVVDGGTLGLALLPLVSTARAVVFVDALQRGLAPGAIEVIGGDTLRAAAGVGTSAQRTGVGDLLAAASLLGTLPDAIALVGVQAGELGAGLEPTDAVRAAVPAAAETVLAVLRALEDRAPALPPGAAPRRSDPVGVVA